MGSISFYVIVFKGRLPIWSSQEVPNRLKKLASVSELRAQAPWGPRYTWAMMGQGAGGPQGFMGPWFGAAWAPWAPSAYTEVLKLWGAVWAFVVCVCVRFSLSLQVVVLWLSLGVCSECVRSVFGVSSASARRHSGETMRYPASGAVVLVERCAVVLVPAAAGRSEDRASAY